MNFDSRSLRSQIKIDLICFSHLRWNFVYQRPQHLLSRAAETMRVFFFEEPIWFNDGEPALLIRPLENGVRVVQPNLPYTVNETNYDETMRRLLNKLCQDYEVQNPILWYYTPHALAFSSHLKGQPTVFDCMDELATFAGADPELPALERRLMACSDLVFTGGQSLFDAKRSQHENVHAFPSGVDAHHFAPARGVLDEPADQAAICHPRMGFYGVLDERLDRALLAAIADLRPETQFILVGPIAKLDLSELPRRPNIHYLGAKTYAELPAYVCGWDVALMPFARNEATRYISPTKTPEYLAAGRPVVSTPIVDVVRRYGTIGGVHIASTPEEFAAATDLALAQARNGGAWLAEADEALADMSWDTIWARMHQLIEAARNTLPPSRSTLVMRRAHYDVVVVGAGFAGTVLAERLAEAAGQRVLVVDRRPHVGGNAHDCFDSAGILVHPYGPHIFHTNSDQVMRYLSRFTEWRPYEHRVLAEVGGMRLPIPINRTTVNQFFGVALSQTEVAAFLAGKAERLKTVQTAADVVLAAVGRELYEAFFQSYTRKQWGLDPSELDKSVTARVPTRTNDDDRYFTDRHQVMPLHGYTAMFKRILDHPNITVATGTEWQEIGHNRWDHLVFTGPVDEYFGHRYGKLPYRSLRFRHENHDVPWKQPVGVLNYPGLEVPYTRITEFKHLTGQEHVRTSLCYEYPSAEGDPYYPVPRPENAALYRRYQVLADAAENVTFAGRLATYQYYNMDQVVGQALATYQKLASRVRHGPVAAE